MHLIDAAFSIIFLEILIRVEGGSEQALLPNFLIGQHEHPEI